MIQKKAANTGLHPTINKKELTDKNCKHVRFIKEITFLSTKRIIRYFLANVQY